jgi:hypothetical protein
MKKRLLVASAVALVLGLIEASVDTKMASADYPVTALAFFGIVFSRTLIGAVLGISSLKQLAWWLHGIIIGTLLSVPAGITIYGFVVNWSPLWAAGLCAKVIGVGLIIGLLVELVTTMLFNQPMEGKKGL